MKTRMQPSPTATAGHLSNITQYSEIKRLADTILALQKQKSFHSLAVLSMFPGEGKTLLSAALAIAYSEASPARVLLVDTTTYHNPSSLLLKQCLPSSHPSINLLSLEDYRRGTTEHVPYSAPDAWQTPAPVLEADAISDGQKAITVKHKSDQSLVRTFAQEQTQQYGLILFDTTALSAHNRNNIDPMLVARTSDASVLVASSQLLNADNLESHLKILKDPILNLMGIISNEEFRS